VSQLGGHAATVEAFGEVTEWMARFADRLQR